jgi:hypothetical protein
MNTKLDGPNISRRGFLACAGAASSVALLAPRRLFAQDDGLVQMARRSASSSNITGSESRAEPSQEKGYPPVYYLPGGDADTSLLVRSGTVSVVVRIEHFY